MLYFLYYLVVLGFMCLCLAVFPVDWDWFWCVSPVHHVTCLSCYVSFVTCHVTQRKTREHFTHLISVHFNLIDSTCSALSLLYMPAPASVHYSTLDSRVMSNNPQRSIIHAFHYSVLTSHFSQWWTQPAFSEAPNTLQILQIPHKQNVVGLFQNNLTFTVKN